LDPHALYDKFDIHFLTDVNMKTGMGNYALIYIYAEDTIMKSFSFFILA